MSPVSGCPWTPPATSRLVSAFLSGRNEQTLRAYWRDLGWQETPVYEQRRLQVGHGFEGPAIIEAEDTTVVVEPGWRYVVDELGNGLLKNA
ncbi:MAG: hypothetical protein QF706_05500 [Roseibacillus sp.]|nr:hypothetical protein [Roseibacillus sp.]MDP7655507.1 hypothetical protein [Roseibacillus sp.]